MALLKDVLEPPRAEPNLTERITRMLMDEITGGQYQLGEILPPEQVIADRLGVSRTVLREAVSRLKAEGIVSSKQGRGLAVIANTPLSVLRLHAAGEEDVEQTLGIVELRRGSRSKRRRWLPSGAPRRIWPRCAPRWRRWPRP